MSSARETAEAPLIEAPLRAWFGGVESVAVALSGGVDSSVVAAVAALELGPRALAVTGVSESLPGAELEAITRFCAERHLAHATVNTRELSNPDYVANSPERCYFCKRELFDVIGTVASARGFAVVVDGTHAEDLQGHRPGKRAAVERGVRSPLAEIGATKASVRALARSLGVAGADRPASPCLSSRIAYGVPVTAERLTRVGRAEAILKSLGFCELRVRLHDSIARIEVPKAELGRAVTNADTILRELKALGFTYVTLDLAGLRSGSLLEVLREPTP
jgi:pyridinium-3,5-biscarboxylic acid mononucleotide sulfurtransferase